MRFAELSEVSRRNQLKIHQINELILLLTDLGKRKNNKSNPKIHRERTITKLREEINPIELIRTKYKMNGCKSRFFDKNQLNALHINPINQK